MHLTKQELIKINDINNFIIDYCSPQLEDYRKDLIYSEEAIKDIVEEDRDIETIDYYFPGEYEATDVEPDDLIEMEEDIKSIEIVHSGLIKTKTARYYIVTANNEEDRYLLRIHFHLFLETEKYHIRLVGESLIIGMAATKINEFDDDWGTASQYLAIEIAYKNLEDIPEWEEEKELIKSFIFEVADSTNIALEFSEIRNPTKDFWRLTENLKNNSETDLRSLIEPNIAMNFFVSAIQINDSELKFLNFYKVLEHFSPIAINIEANELMRKKLDAPRNLFESGDYIRSIYDLATSMKNKFNDEDLIIAAFNSCFDLVSIFEKLPKTIKTRIKKHLKIQELNYQIDKQKITTAENMAGKIIFKTRNKVVHAKSNYNSTGDEIDFDEFEELNLFMKEASSQSIRWYSRQPEHIKSKII